MEGNLIQQKYYNREQFTTEEKEDICAKSDNRCVHCGRPIFVGYQMTVDHFIPLDKGGSNQFINLIPLCKDCNNTKDNKLYSMDYIKYIKPKYRKQLEDYLNSYIHVIDYVQRHRLLAYDEYNSYILIKPNGYAKRNKKTQNLGIKSPYQLKYASWEDLNKMTEYLIKYLKRNNSLDSEESARENIIFWMQFGCIYYIERNGVIMSMFAITIKHLEDDDSYRGIKIQPMMYIFPYYQTQLSEQLLLDAIYRIPKYICEENNLDFIPIKIIMLKVEKMKSLLMYTYDTTYNEDNVNGFIVFHVLVKANDSDDQNCENEYKTYEEMTDSERRTADFFNKFNDVTDNMLEYFEKYEDRESVSWMINSILSVDAIRKSKLSKYVLFEDEDKDDDKGG